MLETAGLAKGVLNECSTLSLSQLEKAVYAEIRAEGSKFTQKEVSERITEELGGVIEYGEKAAPIRAKKGD